MSLKDEFKQELERIGKDMRALGSTIKEKAQKANQSLQKTWAEVEPKIAKFETDAGAATDKAVAELKRSGGELLTQLGQLKDRMTKGEGEGGDDAGEAETEAEGETDTSGATDAEIVDDADKPA